jgi:iron(III) transport system permease protein
MLTLLSCSVALLLLTPLAFLLLQAGQVGWSSLSALMLRGLTATLLWNTVTLTVLVTLACAVVGTAAACVVERIDVPARAWLSVLLVLPLALPDFVVGYTWASWLPWLRGFLAAAVVMTLTLYPLVYLPVVAALRGLDCSEEEIARGLGLSRFQTFRGLTLPQIRPGVLGGSLLVALTLLAEYGAFEILRFQTFTTEIFTEFKSGFSQPAACTLSLILVGLSLVVLTGETLRWTAPRPGHVSPAMPLFHAHAALRPRRHERSPGARRPGWQMAHPATGTAAEWPTLGPVPPAAVGHPKAREDTSAPIRPVPAVRASTPRVHDGPDNPAI